jgi:hypothetical protein
MIGDEIRRPMIRWNEISWDDRSVDKAAIRPVPCLFSPDHLSSFCIVFTFPRNVPLSNVLSHVLTLVRFQVLEFNDELHDRIKSLEKRCLDFEDLKMD